MRQERDMLRRRDNQPTSHPPVREMGKLEERRSPFGWGFIVGAIVAAGVALLFVQNSHSSDFEWLWFNFDAPMWLLLGLTLIAGMVVGEAARFLLLRSSSRSVHRRSDRDTAYRRATFK